MLRDEKVFVMGEEVARYNGAYKVSRIRHHMDRIFWGKITVPPSRFRHARHARRDAHAHTANRSPRVSWTSSERTVLST